MDKISTNNLIKSDYLLINHNNNEFNNLFISKQIEKDFNYQNKSANENKTKQKTKKAVNKNFNFSIFNIKEKVQRLTALLLYIRQRVNRSFSENYSPLSTFCRPFPININEVENNIYKKNYQLLNKNKKFIQLSKKHKQINCCEKVEKICNEFYTKCIDDNNCSKKTINKFSLAVLFAVFFVLLIFLLIINLFSQNYFILFLHSNCQSSIKLLAKNHVSYLKNNFYSKNLYKFIFKKKETQPKLITNMKVYNQYNCKTNNNFFYSKFSSFCNNLKSAADSFIFPIKLK